MGKRLVWIDVVRGVAMVAIVFGHTVDYGPWRTWVYSFHVPLFFVLSGMTFRVKSSFARYCAGKAKRLLVPYCCFGLASILVFAVAGGFAASVLGRTDIITSPVFNLTGLLYGNGKNGMMDFNLPLWFLPCMFVVYVLAYPIVWLEKISPEKKTARACIMVVLVFASFGVASVDPVPSLPFSAENAVLLFPFFYLGTFFGWIDIDAISKPKRIFCGIALFVVGSACAAINAQDGIVDYVATACRTYSLFYIAAILQSSGLIAAISTVKSNSILARIGRNTMPILVMHKFPVVLFQIILSNAVLLEANATENPVIALIIAVVAIVMSLFVGSLLDISVPWVFGSSGKQMRSFRDAATKEE